MPQIFFSVIMCLLVCVKSHASDCDKNLQSAIAMVEQMTNQIDNRLRGLEGIYDVAVWTLGLIELIQRFPFANFRWLEGRLRGLNSSTYLVAHPIVPGYRSRPVLDLPVGDLAYFLWIGGKDEAEEKLRALGISPRQNLENLARTGLLSAN